jgi:hypothetical protein
MPTPPIPQPLRAAAGLAAVAIDSARKLPQQVVGFPVLAVSAALQASLKAQQRYAELVTRGDQLLGQLRGQEEGTPPWARFDDDGPAPARTPSAFDLAEDDPEVADLLAAGEDQAAAMADAHPVAHPVADLLAAGEEDADELAAAEAAADALAAAEERVEVDEPVVVGLPASDPGGEPLAGETPAGGALGGGPLAGETLDPEEEAVGLAEVAELADEVAAGEALDAGEIAVAAAAGTTVDASPELPADDGADAEAVADALAADGYLAADAPVPGYDTFTLPQLRGRLRSLSVDQLEALAAYERATQQRAPFLTMLDNRLATVRAH